MVLVFVWCVVGGVGGTDVGVGVSDGCGDSVDGIFVVRVVVLVLCVVVM